MNGGGGGGGGDGGSDRGSLDNTPWCPLIRVERETSASFMCGISSVSSMSAEYTFSSAFRFGSKVWKLGSKRLKEVYSFLIYPMDVEETSQEEGYAVQMTLLSPSSEVDPILVEGRREFNNNATIFVWTASFTSLKPFLSDDSIYVSFSMKILSAGGIFSKDLELQFPSLRCPANQVVDRKVGSFPIILTGIQNISLNGISSPPFAFEGHTWELKMCQNGNLYAFRIMCNRKVGGRFSVCAKIQLSVRSHHSPPTSAASSVPPTPPEEQTSAFRTIHVEGSRRFSDSDDSMFWSFDKRLDKYVRNDALSVEMKIIIYQLKDKPIVEEATVGSLEARLAIDQLT